jgi:hypothetical protein
VDENRDREVHILSFAATGGTLVAVIRAHYDRIAAFAAALFMVCSALLILGSGLHFRENYPLLQLHPSPNPAVPSPRAAEMERAIDRLRRPAQWTFEARSGLFVPERHFIGPDGFPTTLETTEVHPPVPNEWLEEYGLPIGEGDVLTQDPDADGFDNLEEWQNHTKPTDRGSHPSFIAKLKLKSIMQEPFRLVFSSWMGDTFALNTNDLRGPTQFLRLGDSIRGTRFKLVKFSEKYDANKYGTRIDVSELTVEDRETGEQVNLVKEKVMISPESVANFVYAWSGQREFAVRKDQEFSLKPDERIKYKLVDVQPGKAVIVNIQEPNELIEISPLNP